MGETKQDLRARTLAYGTLPRPALGPKGTVVSPGAAGLGPKGTVVSPGGAPPRPAALAAPPPPVVAEVTGATITGLNPGAGFDATIVDQKADAAFDATIAHSADGPSLDATIAVSKVDTLSPAISTSVVSGPVSGMPTSGRVTVLPRIETVGSETRIVRETRNRYVHEKKLGEGGVGEVLGALDQDIGRRVAVKRLHPGQRSDASLLRFADEVRTIGRLEHPNIIPIHDVGVDDQGDHYFVMKYVDGETLESIIEKLAAGDAAYHAKYTVERRVEIFMSLLEAVGFAHAQGIIHRDIKPANVMVGAYGEVVLMDWGVATMSSQAPRAAGKLRTDDNAIQVKDATTPDASPHSLMPVLSSESNAKTTGAGGIVGTPFYMSPEQARGLPVDERSDVYSLTLLFYEFLGLVHPLEGKKSLAEVLAGAADEPVPSILLTQSKNTPTVPAELTHFLRHGLEKDPSKRFQSVNIMIDRLRARAAGDIPVECPVTFMKQNTNKWTHFVDNHPVVAMAVASVGVLGVLASVSFAFLTAIGVLHR